MLFPPRKHVENIMCGCTSGLFGGWKKRKREEERVGENEEGSFGRERREKCLFVQKDNKEEGLIISLILELSWERKREEN